MEVNVVVELSLSCTPSKSCSYSTTCYQPPISMNGHDSTAPVSLYPARTGLLLALASNLIKRSEASASHRQLARMKLGCEPSSSPRFTKYLSFNIPTERKMNQPSDEFSLNSYAFASFVYLHIHPFGKKKRSKDQKTVSPSATANLQRVKFEEVKSNSVDTVNPK
ncbi:uncharacterized protein RAG0_08317 [Rhynchosporium agropyri]|uniref:Uncharacterized protein n=1 Tax=Rhynchosporium agropyri TaxID=914238 RepID=A0A1E1KQC2_9HELO|nr:uncharacterized protein RAG0_08317 [Rhynchosporium agropyri]